jgi:hypothetical protein
VLVVSPSTQLPLSHDANIDANDFILAGFPLQAYLFAKLITVFAYTGKQLEWTTDHWALMFVILAIGIGVSFFILGWASNTVSYVSIQSPTQDLKSVAYH